MNNKNFSALTDEELLEVYEKRETELENDFQALLSEIAKRWAEKEKIKQLPLKPGDDIWYADPDEMQLEHGTIYLVSYNASGKLDSFSVDFDNGDFDEFIGEALGSHFFRDKDDALAAMPGRELSFI